MVRDGANGWLVEVHQSQNATTLWYRVGRLGSDGEISWSASHQYDKGVVPTLAFTNTAFQRQMAALQGLSGLFGIDSNLLGRTLGIPAELLNVRANASRPLPASARGRGESHFNKPVSQCMTLRTSWRLSVPG